MPTSSIRTTLLTLLFLVFTSFTVNTSHAAKMYKWVDSEGNISYQDQPPPENTKVLTEKTLKSNATPTAVDENNSNKEPVIVYITSDCTSCELVIARLIQLNVPYETRSMEDRDTQKEILDRTDSLLVPTLEINGSLFTDNSKSALDKNLSDAGYAVNQPSN